MEQLGARFKEVAICVDIIKSQSSVYLFDSPETAQYIWLLTNMLDDFEVKAEELTSAFDERPRLNHAVKNSASISTLQSCMDSILSFLEQFQPMSGSHDTQKKAARNRVGEILPTELFTKFVLEADNLMYGEYGIEYKVSELERPPGVSRPAKASADLYMHKLERRRDLLVPAPVLGPWLDPGEIRKWLDHCDNHHGNHCSPTDESRQLFTKHPRWLIDVDLLCLVSSDRQPYLALSYVWGTDRSFKTLKSDLGRLQQYKSLTADFPSLPRAVHDVIILCQKIGERYLWIDALCIVQDDESDKQDHLRNMSSIYINATATLVAAGGPAHNGLRGIEHVTPPMERDGHQPRYLREWHSGNYSMSLHQDIRNHRERIEKSIWNHQAWTFQEQMFSRRLIFLNNESISWECHCAVWLEKVKILDDECRTKKPTVNQGIQRIDVRGFARHVGQYNCRALTYPEDALDAFNSILTVFKKSFKIGFISGLPIQCLDAALLWYNEAPLERRVSRSQGGYTDMPPSWSWAAWEGGISFIDLASCHKIIVPIVNWHHPSRPQESQQRTAVLEKRYEDLRKPSSSIQVTPFNNLLFARPMQAYFRIARVFNVTQVLLADGAGMLISCSRLVDTAEVRGESCEVVAISEIAVGEEIAYNVLWIAWSQIEKDTAYRRGVGRILKSAWPADGHTRCIDLFLG